MSHFAEVASGRKSDLPELAKAMDLCRLTGATLVIAKPAGRRARRIDRRRGTVRTHRILTRREANAGSNSQALGVRIRSNVGCSVNRNRVPLMRYVLFSVLAVLLAGCAVPSQPPVQRVAATASTPASTQSTSASGVQPVVVAPVMPKPSDRCSADRIASARTVQQVLATVRAVPPRGEFETTEAYQARARSAQAQLSDDIAVIVPVPSSHVRYDADRQEMSISYMAGESILASDLASGSEPGQGMFYHIIVSQDIRQTGTYTGSNAFGRQVTVIRQEGSRTGLTIPGLISTGWPVGYSSTGVTLRMDPEAARVAKDGFAVLFVGSLWAPYILTGRVGRSPTIQRPYDTTISLRSLNMEPVCAVLVNRGTGEVVRPLRLRS